MRVINFKTVWDVLCLLALSSVIISASAQEVPIPDPGLNAAIRAELQKPTGPLTEADLLTLNNLRAGGRSIRDVAGLEAARNLHILELVNNSITNFAIASALTNLTILDLFNNQLTTFILSNALPNLTIIDIAFNSLAQCSLPAGLGRLDTLFLEGNALTNFTLPAGLTRLTQLDLSGNSLTSLTLPPDMTNLTTLILDGNPLTTLVLPEPLATTTLAPIIDALQNQGVNVFTYPLTVQLSPRPQQPTGALRFGLTGPPGDYIVFTSTNLATWSVMALASLPLGAIIISDTTAQFSPRKFYRAVRQTLPANLVFIGPNAFTMGSPTNEIGHQADEGPQTGVTLSHGFWMGKFEVTQREYLAVTGENPSGFPGNLDRPVESVSWFAASNYCAQLTVQDLAAGRIPPGTHYRLPTEAEWECAARAGTTTRFDYGDDPELSDLSKHAWFGAHNGVTTHPVGQKLPNAWGLYDMAGNVWEWCQDWYGTYPGGTVTDPQGPATNPIGWKVIRGGAWEASEFDCRSASRWFEGASPFISDFIIGFRVVLATERQ